MSSNSLINSRRQGVSAKALYRRQDLGLPRSVRGSDVVADVRSRHPWNELYPFIQHIRDAAINKT